MIYTKAACPLAHYSLARSYSRARRDIIPAVLSIARSGMAVGPVNALVDEVLTYTSDYDANTLREEAVNLAFDMKLGADELAELLSALEARTGTNLERRGGIRPTLTPKPLIKRH